MKIIVGLGNPGKQYEGTRHNAGVVLVERLATSVQESERIWRKNKGIVVMESENLVLVKSSEYFMNESGKIIEALGNRHWAIDDLYVVHDDLDIRLGEYKIQFGKGPEVHGGVMDIERVVGKDFWRIRIGIENRGTPRIPGEEYVLQKFSPDEIVKLQSVIDAIAKGFN